MRQKAALLCLALTTLGATSVQATPQLGEAATLSETSRNAPPAEDSPHRRGVEGFEVHWFTVDGGGGSNSSGGEFSLSATIGQSDAASAMTGGQFLLRPGFWTPVTGEPCGIFCDGFESGDTTAWSAEN